MFMGKRFSPTHLGDKKNPMKFGIGQSMSYHIIECLIVCLHVHQQTTIIKVGC
jgi:hypothetical protein